MTTKPRPEVPAALKDAYPCTRFTVRTAAGRAKLAWMDGPTRAAVRALAPDFSAYERSYSRAGVAAVIRGLPFGGLMVQDEGKHARMVRVSSGVTLEQFDTARRALEDWAGVY